MILPPPQPVHRNISHAAHLIGTILTCGLWAPFWALAAMNTSRANKRMNRKYAQQLHEYNMQMRAS